MSEDVIQDANGEKQLIVPYSYHTYRPKKVGKISLKVQHYHLCHVVNFVELSNSV